MKKPFFPIIFKRILYAVLACSLCVSLLCCRHDDTRMGGEAVTFTDALGRTVTVEKGTVRAAALLGSFADIWMLSGGSLCAAANDAWADFGLADNDVINLGGAHSPSAELLLSSAPSLVLASASTASNVALRTLLEHAGITVAYFRVDHFEDYLSMLDICTQITGRRDLYDTNGLQIKERIAAIRECCAAADLPAEKRTVLLLRISSGKIKAKGSESTVLGRMLADMGCINIADGGDALLEDLSIEDVIRQQPYHIFAVAMGDDTEQAMTSLNLMIEEDPAWGTLDAVVNGRLHLLDKNLFHLKPNARWAIAYETLYQILTEE